MSSHRHSTDRFQNRHPSHSGAPSIMVDLGTGVLTSMRIASGLDEIKPRLALRERPRLNPNYTQGDARMRVVLCASHGHRTKHIDTDFSFDVPVDIDMLEDNTPTYSMGKVTDDEARLHGYATANDMRKSLGFKKGEDGIIFSYKIETPPIQQNDLALAGERARMIRAAHEAFRGTKGDNILSPRTGTLRESREHSIQRARAYLDALPRTAALIAEASITPREHLVQAQLVPFAPEVQETKRPREQQLRSAKHRLQNASNRFENETDPHQRARLKGHIHKLNATIARLEKAQIVPSEIAVMRLHATGDETAADNKKTAKKPKPQAQPDIAGQVSYSTEFGKRGQYTHKVKRGTPQAYAVLTPQELRAIQDSKMHKKLWRDRVARASFGVGDDLPEEPEIFRDARLATLRAKPQAQQQQDWEDYLNEEGVPPTGDFSADDYLYTPRGGGRGGH